jgi:hypothetical protein
MTKQCPKSNLPNKCFCSKAPKFQNDY